VTDDERNRLIQIHKALYGNGQPGLIVTVREMEAHLYGTRGRSGLVAELAETNRRLKDLEAAVAEFLTVIKTIRGVLAFFGLTTLSGVVALFWLISRVAGGSSP
jgi:hypothetical protein